MRLIDADKLRHELIMGHDLVGAKYIDLAETVKAIPMGWIMWKWRRNQPYDTQEDAWMRSGVLKMLRDWERENETN